MKRLAWIVILASVLNYLACKHSIEPSIDDGCSYSGPIEDTTRIYLHPGSGDTLFIYPKMIFARFRTHDDTASIISLISRYGLTAQSKIFEERGGLLAATLCIGDGRRPEFYFMPYRDMDVCNFGADSLVDYAFGTFIYGYYIPTGQIVFRFRDGTPEDRIDSLFSSLGLSLTHTTPDFPAGTRYWTTTTRSAQANVLDLYQQVKNLSYLDYASVVGMAGVTPDLVCQ